MQYKKTNTRNSNIELLRILAMMGVIILHYNNTQIGGAFKYASSIKLNCCILYMLECIFISAVNVFLLISGYYMCSSKKVSISKPFQLIIQVIFFRVSSFIIFVLINKIPYSNKELQNSFLPINYFVILYVALYVLTLFSIWPTIVDILIHTSDNSLSELSTISMFGSQYGYTIVNFMLMYILGAYIFRLNITKHTNYRQRFVYFSLLILCWLVLFVCSQYNINTQNSIIVTFSYCNPFVIASSIITFILFVKLKPRTNKLINTLAKGSFTVYLTHTYFFDLLNIDKFATRQPFILITHIIISCTFIYIICWILSLIYSGIEKLLLTPIYKKLNSICITCE